MLALRLSEHAHSTRVLTPIDEHGERVHNSIRGLTESIESTEDE